MIKVYEFRFALSMQAFTPVNLMLLDKHPIEITEAYPNSHRYTPHRKETLLSDVSLLL